MPNTATGRRPPTPLEYAALAVAMRRRHADPAWLDAVAYYRDSGHAVLYRHNPAQPDRPVKIAVIKPGALGWELLMHGDHLRMRRRRCRFTIGCLGAQAEALASVAAHSGNAIGDAPARLWAGAVQQAG